MKKVKSWSQGVETRLGGTPGAIPHANVSGLCSKHNECTYIKDHKRELTHCCICPTSLLFSGWLYGLYDKQRNPKYKHFTLNIFVFTIFTGQWIYVSWSLECDGHRQLAGLHHFHLAAFVCNPDFPLYLSSYFDLYLEFSFSKGGRDDFH